jgi:diguanylate cyclase (GGDEF)-like protein
MTIGRLGWFFSSILVLSLVAIWVIFAGLVYESYSNEWASVSLFVNNVNSLLEQAIARDIDLYDLSLKSTVAGYANPDTMALPPAIRQHVLFDQSTDASGLGSVLVLDAEGTVVADSRSEVPRAFNGRDKDYFQVHVDGKFERELFVSHPFKSKFLQDMWTIGLSRRLEDAKGNFDGIVLGTLKLSYFAHLFGAVDMPHGSTIAILHDDGTILMASPYADIGRDLRGSELYRHVSQAQSGELRAPSPLDKSERFYAFKRIGRLPITLAVGIPTSHFLTKWWWRMAFVALGFFILSGLIVVLAITLSRELRRRAMAERSLSELAATDGLTGLANRRHFDETLDLEWRRATRDQKPLALLMVDGDYFKKFNDTYGHLQGDQALRAIAGALRDSVKRPADLVARFGGEEFAVLLPNTDIDGAARIGELARGAVARLDCQHLGSPLGRLTISIGAASCLPRESSDPLSLLQAADFALYEAKAAGRDRVGTHVAPDLADFSWRDGDPVKKAG